MPAGGLISAGTLSALGAIGGGAGAAGGASLLGGLGGGAGSAIASGALGAGQLIQGLRQKKKAEGLTPPPVDPQVQAMLDEINRKRKSIETGSAFQTGIREVEQLGASTMEGLKGVTGGNVGGTIAAFMKAQRGTGTNINKVLGQADQMNQYFTGLATDLTNRIAQRKLDLRMYDKVGALAEAAQSKKEGFANILGTVAGNVPLGGGGGGGLNDILGMIGRRGGGFTGADVSVGEQSIQPIETPGINMGEYNPEVIA